MTTNKTTSRLIFVQSLYSLDINNAPVDQTHLEAAVKKISKVYIKENKDVVAPDTNFLNKLTTELVLNLASIDDIISSNSTKRRDMNPLIKSILRGGACEMLYCNTPRKVAINEYTGLSRSFFSTKEIAFVNAVLDKIVIRPLS